MTFVWPYLATLVVFLGIDAIWLGFVARETYRAGIGHLMADGFNLYAAIAFYLIYVAGIQIFAVQPSVGNGGWQKAVMLGALFGFFAYATYDLTNLATLRDWPLKLSLIDMAWGAVLTGIAAAAGAYVASR